MGKSVQILNTLKKTCLGVLQERRTRQRLWNRFEGGRRNRNLNHSAFHIRDARSLRFEYLPSSVILINLTVPVSSPPYFSFHHSTTAHLSCKSANCFSILASLVDWSDNSSNSPLNKCKSNANITPTVVVGSSSGKKKKKNLSR